jgi:hypothetical protein
VEEVSLDSMGCSTLTSARPSDHYGFFQTGDGRIFEGPNVDNHFNQVIIYLLKLYCSKVTLIKKSRNAVQCAVALPTDVS